MVNTPDGAVRRFWRDGEPFVWATGAALTITLMTTATLMAVVMINGLGVMWPADLTLATLKDGTRVLGEITDAQPTADRSGTRLQFKVGNRDLYGADFRWVDEAAIAKKEQPGEAFVLERREYGDFFGYLTDLKLGEGVDSAGALPERFQAARKALEPKRESLGEVEDSLLALNNRASAVERKLQRLAYRKTPDTDATVVSLKDQQSSLRKEFETLAARQSEQAAALRSHTAIFADASGATKEIPLVHIVRAYRPNAMGWLEKSLFYLSKGKELLTDEPRESNTEGGLFPAILGTVMLIFTMSIFSFPLGVMAGVYLREYARQGMMVRLVRIAVNNLAGIPSIVYGIFGLGFFIYGIGGSIDSIFFPERLPTPTFGTGGILWASLTLGLLTVPVVIVSTEEALGTIPRSMREGSQALGATKFQTLLKVILPMASPGIMTGFILSMARAAGEVAPLMITGVVKLAPAMPVDSEFPFLHLDRKFMHLGFHIYDIGFQSPNVEAAKPMVFVTTLLLLVIVLIMSSLAIYLRNKMRRRYRVTTI